MLLISPRAHALDSGIAYLSVHVFNVCRLTIQTVPSILWRFECELEVMLTHTRCFLLLIRYYVLLFILHDVCKNACVFRVFVPTFRFLTLPVRLTLPINDSHAYTPVT